MRKPRAEVRAEIVVQKSRFLGIIKPVATQEEAREVLKILKEEYDDASHVVHGFVTGRQNSLITGCSDDGEPPGTAGRPVSDVLKGSMATGIFLGIVRWFGGTKLGTGGLVKAYQECAKAVLEKVDWEEDLDWSFFSLETEYGVYEILKKDLLSRQGVLETELFAQRVSIRGKILTHSAQDWDRWFTDLCRGRDQIQWEDGPPGKINHH